MDPSHLTRPEFLPVNEKSPIAAHCLKAATKHIDSGRLIEAAGRPHLLNNSKIFTEEEMDWLLPPIVVYSASPNTPHRGSKYGLAREDQEFHLLGIFITSLLGAAEQLVGLVEDDVYQFCSHGKACVHYKSALCHQYFSPPSRETGHVNCGFVKAFKNFTGEDPISAWEKWGSVWKEWV